MLIMFICLLQNLILIKSKIKGSNIIFHDPIMNTLSLYFEFIKNFTNNAFNLSWKL